MNNLINISDRLKIAAYIANMELIYLLFLVKLIKLNEGNIYQLKMEGCYDICNRYYDWFLYPYQNDFLFNQGRDKIRKYSRKNLCRYYNVCCNSLFTGFIHKRSFILKAFWLLILTELINKFPLSKNLDAVISITVRMEIFILNKNNNCQALYIVRYAADSFRFSRQPGIFILKELIWKLS